LLIEIGSAVQGFIAKFFCPAFILFENPQKVIANIAGIAPYLLMAIKDLSELALDCHISKPLEHRHTHLSA
jgi:hypothetical protein